MADEPKGPGESPGSQTVDINAINTAPTEVPNAGVSSTNAQKEATVLAHEAEQFSKKLGLFGVPFGGRSEKPGDISALVICACLILMPALYITERVLAVKYGKEAGGFDFDRVFSALTSIVTLVLGYLFGSNEKSSK